MNLQVHPFLHYIMELSFYHLGLLANILAGAHITTRSNINAVQTVGQYFRLRAIPLFVRWVSCLALFLLVWENTKILNLDQYLANLAQHMGLALFSGIFSDAFFDKAVALILPGIQKELPKIPDANQKEE